MRAPSRSTACCATAWVPARSRSRRTRSFPRSWSKRGFARPTTLEQYQMARHDVGFAFVDELNAQGYAKPQTSELVRAGQHGVQAAYVRDLGALGYRLGSLAPLIELRDHGVTPAYIRELGELGYKGLPVDDLAHGARSRRHAGVRQGDAGRRVWLASDAAADQRTRPRRQPRVRKRARRGWLREAAARRPDPDAGSRRLGRVRARHARSSVTR